MATVTAIRRVSDPRFHETEGGYQGAYYHALHVELTACGVLRPPLILETEHQKTSAAHGTSQRPDIILHVPRGSSGAPAFENNHAVWALKRRASSRDAQEDFAKLDIMFQELAYPLGFFLNIDDRRPHHAAYAGPFAERIVTLATWLEGGVPQIAIGGPERAGY